MRFVLDFQYLRPAMPGTIIRPSGRKLGWQLCFAAALFSLLLSSWRASAQEEAAAEPETLDKRIVELYQQGKFAAAVPLAQRMVEIRKRAAGEDAPAYATALNALAELYRKQAKYAEAEPLYKRSLAIREKALGLDHPDVATSLDDLAVLYENAGKYSEAELLCNRGLTIREKTFGPDHPDVAKSLNNLASIYSDQGKHAESEALFKRSLAIREKALGPDHPDVAETLNNLAAVYTEQGKYAEADPLYKRSLAIREKALGPDHPDVGTSLNYLAELYLWQGKLAEAEPLYKRGLAIREKALGPEHPDVASSLNDLAVLYKYRGKYAEAEPLYKRGLAIREKALGPEHPVVANSLNDLAALYYYQGKYAEAEPLFERSLAIREKALGPDHPNVASGLNDLAALYYDQGKYAEAEPLYKRSLAIWEKALGPEHPEVANSLNNLATLYDEQGKYVEAEPLYKRSLAIREKALGPEHPDVAYSLNNLALLYKERGKYVEAEPLYKRGLAISEKALGPEHPRVAAGMNNVARLYDKQGKYAEAEPFFERSLAIWERALGPDHPNVASSLNNLAALYMEQGKYAEAEPLYKRSLAIRAKALGPDHPNVAASLNNLAALYMEQGKYVEAEPFFERGLQSLSRQFETSFTYMSEKDRLAFLGTVSERFPIYFSFVATYHRHMPALTAKAYDLLLWEKGMVASSIEAQRARIAASGDAGALQLLDQLTAKRNQYAALVSARPAKYEQWRKQLQQVGEEANELEKQLARHSAGFAHQQQQLRASWRDVQKALKSNEAAVEFVRFHFYDGKQWTKKDYYAALVVRPHSIMPQWVMLREAKDLEGAPLEDYRALVAFSGRPSQIRASVTKNLGSRFYRAFWQPLEAKLGDANRIYVSPDGVLSQVSLAVVPGKRGRLLMETYDLRIVNSTKDLLRPAVSSTTHTAVLVGNPTFQLSEADQRTALASIRPKVTEMAAVQTVGGGEVGTMGVGSVRSRDLRGSALPDLPATQQEVEDISKLLVRKRWRVQTFTEKQALEEVVKGVRQPRVLHLATHGFFEADQPRQLAIGGEGQRASGLEDPMLRSGVYLAGADRVLNGAAATPGLDDGVLTAYEATQLNLQGTELVVLSACETGLGKIEAGEGVFGLRRALQEAGAESVLMSLWSVPDIETRELMTLFYQNWLSGMDKHRALREAQQHVRRKVRARDGHDEPFFWGAFVLVGR